MMNRSARADSEDDDPPRLPHLPPSAEEEEIEVNLVQDMLPLDGILGEECARARGISVTSTR